MNFYRIVTCRKIRNKTIILCTFASVPPDHQLTAAQIVILRQTMNKIRETVHRIASEHRDLHSTVSKVGKAIDRVSFISILSVWSSVDSSVHTKTTAFTLRVIYPPEFLL